MKGHFCKSVVCLFFSYGDLAEFIVYIYILEPTEGPSDDESLSSISSDSEENKVANDDEEEEVRLAWKPSGGPVSLGDWEQHTTVSG